LSDRDAFDAVFMRETSPAIVAPVQPFRTNERVTSQQGLFLCPNSLLFGFEFGLKHVLKNDKERNERLWREHEKGDPVCLERLFKLYVAPQAREELLKELHRMNVNYATLFPGLDGFARSLNTMITISGNSLFDAEIDFRI
jgi:hypothetical protein